MNLKKREHTAVFKAKVAVAALKEELTQAQITSRFGVHTTQVRRWKETALNAIQEGFTKRIERDRREQEVLTNGLYEEIGRLQTELNGLKKKSGFNE